MFVSEYFGLGDELDKKEIFDCILDKDSPFFINLMRLEVCDIPEFQGSYQSINDYLKLYSERTGFINSPAKVKAIVPMSECTEEYAKKRLPVVPMITVRHLPWMVICNLAEELRINRTIFLGN